MKKRYIKPRSTIVAVQFEHALFATSRPPISVGTESGSGDGNETIDGPIPGDDEEIPTETKHFTFDIWADDEY